MDGNKDFTMTQFEPGLGAERQYRNALGSFGTGVTIVTARGQAGPVGITANSFSSVSLDPALVLWSVDKKSDRFAVFNEARFCAIHVLGDAQADLALSFARKGFDHDGVAWEEGLTDAPLLPDCLTRFECELHANHDAGDHRILVQRVLRVTTGTGAPLLFTGGKFGGFSQWP